MLGLSRLKSKSPESGLLGCLKAWASSGSLPKVGAGGLSEWGTSPNAFWEQGTRPQAPGPPSHGEEAAGRSLGKPITWFGKALASCQVLPTFDPVPISLRESQTGEGCGWCPKGLSPATVPLMESGSSLVLRENVSQVGTKFFFWGSLVPLFQKGHSAFPGLWPSGSQVPASSRAPLWMALHPRDPGQGLPLQNQFEAKQCHVTVYLSRRPQQVNISQFETLREGGSTGTQGQTMACIASSSLSSPGYRAWQSDPAGSLLLL